MSRASSHPVNEATWLVNLPESYYTVNYWEMAPPVAAGTAIKAAHRSNSNLLFTTHDGQSFTHPLTRVSLGLNGEILLRHPELDSLVVARITPQIHPAFVARVNEVNMRLARVPFVS